MISSRFWGQNSHLVCVPMDLVTWFLAPVVLPALLDLRAAGAGGWGVEVCLGDSPADDAVLDGLD